jgi:hypothetical protein
MNVSTRLKAGFAVILVSTTACGGDKPVPDVPVGAEEASTAQEPASGSVTILEPVQGAEVNGGLVTVRLGASGVDIVPAGDMTPGTGHHHLYLDEGLGAVGVPVPAIPGRVIHMGTGVSEYEFQDVAPGPHRLIAVVGDGAHVPLQPWVVDTVTFTVR